MDEQLTPSVLRAIEAASVSAARAGRPEVEPVHVLLGIAQQDETRGARLLGAHGLPLALLEPFAPPKAPDTADLGAEAREVPLSATVRAVLRCVRDRARARGVDRAAGTDVLLSELLRSCAELRASLLACGGDVANLERALNPDVAAETSPLLPEFERLELDGDAESVDVHRILDAAANRACEGLRVLEDYARFACDDAFVTAQLKAIRHDTRESLSRLPRINLIASRDTEQDVGRTEAADWQRVDAAAVVAANAMRAQEALRTLEEFGKIQYRSLAEAMQTARYRLYTLERVLLIGADSRTALENVVLYVIVSSAGCTAGIDWTVREAIDGGAQVIQLREKHLGDRELVAIARRIRRITRDAGIRFIMNDRPDIARLAGADGVHVGQEELSVKDVRRMVGEKSLIGVSTHSIEQARQAVLDGANYLGVGPTFPSVTKEFSEFPGLELVRRVHCEIRLPAFVIGGVTAERIAVVRAAGGSRIAVSAAVCAADDPKSAARDLRTRLEATGPG